MVMMAILIPNNFYKTERAYLKDALNTIWAKMTA